MLVTIIEGGELSYTLTRILRLFNHSINIVKQESEANIDKIVDQEIHVIYGTGIDVSILSKPCISQSDVVISLMDNDADNLAACLYIKENYCNKKTITRVNNPKYMKRFEQLGIDIAFSSALIALNPMSLDKEQ
ncbi:MAG: transport system, NAD-binding component [Clostridia bacterium]|jgi:Trk K+ transport system NAD-binding subunit|nr:transport system, NAD-binding component [Clostridia bacterium]